LFTVQDEQALFHMVAGDSFNAAYLARRVIQVAGALIP
jgi:hypothetical protein